MTIATVTFENKTGDCFVQAGDSGIYIKRPSERVRCRPGQSLLIEGQTDSVEGDRAFFDAVTRGFLRKRKLQAPALAFGRDRRELRGGVDMALHPVTGEARA